MLKLKVVNGSNALVNPEHIMYMHTHEDGGEKGTVISFVNGNMMFVEQSTQTIGNRLTALDFTLA